MRYMKEGPQKMRTPLERYIASHYDGAFRDRRVEIIDTTTAIVWNNSQDRVTQTLRRSIQKGKNAREDQRSRKTTARTAKKAPGRNDVPDPNIVPQKAQRRTHVKLNDLSDEQRDRLFGKE